MSQVRQGVLLERRGEATREELPWEAAVRNALARVFPTYPDDETLHEAGTFSVPSGTILRATILLRKDYVYYVKLLYVDPAPDVTYTWEVDGRWEFEGNEHAFSCPLRIFNTYVVRLKITNSSTEDRELDWIIDGWARPVT